MSENAYIEEQRILKQCYLREEILEAGYDPYSFKLHMETLKEDGSNIDNWTLADLQKAVIAFKKQPQFERIPQEEVLIQEKRPDNPQTHIESLSEIEGVNIEPNEEQKTQFQRPIKEVLTKEGDTLALDVPIRKQKSCFEGPLPSQISIIRTEEEKGGFFGIGRTHVVYIVSSEPCEWEVKRRFKDFTWLRETLAKLYPGFLVPIMTKKKTGKGKLEYYNIRKKAYLNSFLQSLSKSPELISNEYTMSFLSMLDDKKFRLKKKEGELLKGPSKLEEHMNLEGKAEVRISEDHKVFSHYISEYIDASANVYHMVQKKSKKLLLELDQVSTSFFEIARHFEELFKLTNDTSGKIMKSNRLDGLKDIYVSLNNMMVSWGNSLVKQTNYLQENMNYFLKYQSKQTASFQELLKTRQTALNDYNRFKIRLESKKDKLWLSSEPSKWELAPNLKITRQELLQNKLMAYKQMCFKENEVEIGLRNTFGYLNEQTMKEVSMGLELKAFGYRKLLEGLTKETQVIYESMLKEWLSNNEFCFNEMAVRPSLNKGSSYLAEKLVRKSEAIKSNEKYDRRLDSDSD